VRCFQDDDVIHVAGQVDPVSDVEIIETELMLADIQTLENALPKAERSAKSGDKEAKLRVQAIKRCQEHLSTDQPLRKLELPEAEAKEIASYGLMTAKPILYIANIDEDDLTGQAAQAAALRQYAEKTGAVMVPVCAKLEAELAELELPDRQEMLDSLGLAEPALATVARQAYRTLRLQSYFTAGEKEVRAWTIPVGATAPQGAGVIHTDFERGFIRCEVYSLADLEHYGSEKEIRSNGKLRTEGKSYILQDGDICHFLFNV
jgi:GTP-binding protein YchF